MEQAFWEMIVRVVGRLDLVTTLAVFIVALFKGWIVLGYHYTEKSVACEKWERLALRGTNLAESAVTLATTTAAQQPRL